MRLFCIVALFLFLGPIVAARGEDGVFQAGIMRLTVASETPFDVLAWYPTQVEEVPWQAGPFTVPATRNAPVAQGAFPVLLLSHGGGLGGGTPLLLRELASSLARRGFVVVAPFHGKTGLQGRLPQIIAALATVRGDPRLGPHADAARLGMLGFSLGTAVTLELAGALPNPDHLVTYCAVHSDDAMSCDHAPDDGNRPVAHQPATVRAIPPPASLPLRAIALLDPFAVLFQRPELTAVTMPVLILRPDHSELPGEANALGLAAALPRPPEFHVLPGSHFVFADQCPDSLRPTAPQVCQDRPGVDRAAVHRTVEADVATFFHKHL